MLTTVEYLSLLREYMRKNAAKYGISRMGIFGSVARGEQHEGSDVDICVEIDRPSIFTLVHIKEELEKLLKCPVDVVRLRNNMDELLRGCINNPECDFMSWQKPSAVRCKECGGYMVEKGKKLVCADKECGYVTDKEEEK